MYKAPDDENADKAVDYIKKKSEEFKDGLFSVNYDFLVWIEQQYEAVNGRKQKLPLDLEQFWSGRVAESMSDVLFSLFAWVYPNRATASGFFEWLEQVYLWEK